MSHRQGSRGGSRGPNKNLFQRPPPGIQTGINQYAGYNQHPQMPLLPPPPPQYGQAMLPPPNMYSNQHTNQPTQYMYVPVPMPQQQQPPPPMPPQYIPPLMAQPVYQPMNQGSTLQSGNFNWNSHHGVPPTEHETRDIKKSLYVPQGQRKSTKKIKDKKDKNKVDQDRDLDGSGQIKQGKDERFKRVKSLLADEPTEHYKSETGPQHHAIEREHRQRGNRGGRRCREQNTQEDNVEDSGSSEDSETDSDDYDFGSKSDFRDQHSDSYDRGSQRNLSDRKSQGLNKKFVKSLESVNNIGYRGTKQSIGGKYGNNRGGQRKMRIQTGISHFILLIVITVSNVIIKVVEEMVQKGEGEAVKD